jgi:acyl carrier protein
MIDDEYDVTIKGDELRAAKTINDVFELVKSKK